MPTVAAPHRGRGVRGIRRYYRAHILPDQLVVRPVHDVWLSGDAPPDDGRRRPANRRHARWRTVLREHHADQRHTGSRSIRLLQPRLQRRDAGYDHLLIGQPSRGNPAQGHFLCGDASAPAHGVCWWTLSTYRQSSRRPTNRPPARLPRRHLRFAGCAGRSPCRTRFANGLPPSTRVGTAVTPIPCVGVRRSSAVSMILRCMLLPRSRRNIPG